MRHAESRRRRRLAIGAASVLAVIVATAIASTSTAAPTAPPKAEGEPVLSGTPRIGEVLRTTRGSWVSTSSITYAYRWYRCQGRGAADASDCVRIGNAPNDTYKVREGDAGFSIRSQIVATNADGSTRSTSNPIGPVQSARPSNVTPPAITGAAVKGSRLTASRGQWVGNTPITYAFRWLRCNSSADDCVEIDGATDGTYLLVQADVGRKIRVRVTARNDAGSKSVLSDPTAAVQSDVPPTGGLPVSSLQSSGDQLVISQVVFAPNPVTSRTAPITVRVKVTARQGRPVSGALVFVRATPRVVEGQTAPTQPDGWVTVTVVPNDQFPQPRSGFNVQFFVRAYRSGDTTPNLDSSILVQVPLSN
jgi:hypothetical protein